MKLSMMKKVLLIFILSIFVLQGYACNAEAEPRSTFGSVDRTVSCLKSTPSDGDPPEKWKNYFDCFPDHFELFVKVFGDKMVGDQVVYSPLYFTAPEHITVKLPRTKQYVGASAYAKKLISLATTAKWDADAPNYLRHILVTELDQNSPMYLEILSEKSDEEIRIFWRFIFDGPHGVHLKNIYCEGRDSFKACQVLSLMMSKTK